MPSPQLRSDAFSFWLGGATLSAGGVKAGRTSGSEVHRCKLSDVERLPGRLVETANGGEGMAASGRRPHPLTLVGPTRRGGHDITKLAKEKPARFGLILFGLHRSAIPIQGNIEIEKCSLSRWAMTPCSGLIQVILESDLRKTPKHLAKSAAPPGPGNRF